MNSTPIKSNSPAQGIKDAYIVHSTRHISLKKEKDKSMETKLKILANFQPDCSWGREEDQEVLEVRLKGCREDQLHACINDEGEVTICRRKENSFCITKKVCTGCKKVDSFCEIIKVSTGCKRDGIDVTFSDGILSLKTPKRSQNGLETAATTLKLGSAAVLLVLVAVQAFTGCI